VLPKYWSSIRQCVKPPTQREPDNDYENINRTIRIFRDKAEEAISNALKNNINLSEAYFRNYFGNKYSKPHEKGFFEWFDEYINTNRPNRAEKTISGQSTIYNFFKEYEKDTKTKIDIKTIDMSFFDSLKDFAFIKRGINDNYFARIIRVLKSMLNWSKERGLEISHHYNKFKATEREKEIIFLTIDELMKLYEYKFKNNRLEKARDIYCFGCFTGLRVSDILELNREHIKEGAIHKSIKKTRRNDIIPLNQFSQQIIDKYIYLEDTPLPQISAQKLNDYIKECCQIAGIDSMISMTRFSGGKAIEKHFPKYELITFHTARKTFLTNSIILGMNYMAARGISGHKKDKDFNRYVKIAENFMKNEMEKTWNTIKKKE